LGFFGANVTKLPYNKPYKDGLSLAIKLIYKGLSIDSLKRASHVIEAISYFRFKAYFSPFMKDGKFIPGTTLDDILTLYKFDIELRCLFFKYISRIEIFVRSSLDQALTKHTRNPFWYLDSNVFSSNKKDDVVGTVLEIRKSFLRSKEDFSEHYKSKYFNDFSALFNDLPPGWIAIEIMTYGQVKRLMDSLDRDVELAIYPDIYKKFGMRSTDTFKSWIDVLYHIRNICAHHNRLFNRNLKAPSNIKSFVSSTIGFVKITNPVTGNQTDQLNRLYSAMAVIHYLTKEIDFDCNISSEIKALISKFSITPEILRSMGFPYHWESESLFQS
jgi:abortive infection bacteriophage resistance protein